MNDMDDGRAIARQFHTDYLGFIRSIATDDEHELRQKAHAYAAYINSLLPKQRDPLTAEQVVARWQLAIAKVTQR